MHRKLMQIKYLTRQKIKLMVKYSTTIRTERTSKDIKIMKTNNEIKEFFKNKIRIKDEEHLIKLLLMYMNVNSMQKKS